MNYLLLFQVFFAVVIGAFALGNAAPNLQNFSVAKGAAYALWEIMDTVSANVQKKKITRLKITLNQKRLGMTGHSDVNINVKFSSNEFRNMGNECQTRNIFCRFF